MNVTNDCNNENEFEKIRISGVNPSNGIEHSGCVQGIWCHGALLSAMQTGGSGTQATSSGAAGRRQVRVFMCPLFDNRWNEDGSAGKTGLSDRLILGNSSANQNAEIFKWKIAFIKINPIISHKIISVLRELCGELLWYGNHIRHLRYHNKIETQNMQKIAI